MREATCRLHFFLPKAEVQTPHRQTGAESGPPGGEPPPLHLGPARGWHSPALRPAETYLTWTRTAVLPPRMGGGGSPRLQYLQGLPTTDQPPSPDSPPPLGSPSPASPTSQCPGAPISPTARLPVSRVSPVARLPCPRISAPLSGSPPRSAPLCWGLPHSRRPSLGPPRARRPSPHLPRARRPAPGLTRGSASLSPAVRLEPVSLRVAGRAALTAGGGRSGTGRGGRESGVAAPRLRCRATGAQPSARRTPVSFDHIRRRRTPPRRRERLARSSGCGGAGRAPSASRGRSSARTPLGSLFPPPLGAWRTGDGELRPER